MLMSSYFGTLVKSSRAYYVDPISIHRSFGTLDGHPITKVIAHCFTALTYYLQHNATMTIISYRQIGQMMNKQRQTCGQTGTHLNKYDHHRIQGQKDKHLSHGEDKSHKHNQQCEKNGVDLGRAHQQSPCRLYTTRKKCD